MTRQQLAAELEQEAPVLKGKDVWVWGAGNTALHCQETIKRCDIDLCGYCDNAPNKWGGSFAGKPVISPEKLLGGG